MLSVLLETVFALGLVSVSGDMGQKLVGWSNPLQMAQALVSLPALIKDMISLSLKAQFTFTLLSLNKEAALAEKALW